jgi:DNA-binding MarR family transcriptional regulator
VVAPGPPAAGADATDVGILAAHLLYAFQKEMFTELSARGHARLRPRHGAVLAYIDPDGTRASDLSARSGQHKQVIGTLVDELEDLGFVTRRPDPSDRRAKLVVPTKLGRDQLVQAERIRLAIERQYAEQVGADRFAAFKKVFAELVPLEH